MPGGVGESLNIAIPLLTNTFLLYVLPHFHYVPHNSSLLNLASPCALQLSSSSLTPVFSLSFPSRPPRCTIKAAESGHPPDGLSACRTEGETPALPHLEGCSQ